MKKFLIIFALFFGACGYKPVGLMTKDIISDSVFVDVIIYRNDPQNAVAIKDGVRDAVIKRLGRDLSEKQNAQTIIIASIASVQFLPISFDKYGFINAYEAIVNINYQVKLKDGSMQNISTTGTSTFRMSQQIEGTIYTDSVISNKDRYNAIYNASSESFDELIARLALLSKKDK